MRSSAFTLIELLVVVTIIVVLLAMLAPALDKAVTETEKAVCGSRLHQWGRAVSTYWLENQRKLMGSVRFKNNKVNPYPNVVWVGSPGKGGQFAVDPIRPYIQGITEVGMDGGLPILQLGGAWYCPGTKLTTQKNAWNTKRRDKTQGDANNVSDTAFITAAELQAQAQGTVPPFFVPDYTYYGRVSDWQVGATHAERLTDKSLSADRLLMSDSLYRWGGGNPTGAWSFNHSPGGHSIFSPNLGGPNITGEPAFSGINQLFGDGSVVWKPRNAFAVLAMESGDDDAPHTGTADRNYY